MTITIRVATAVPASRQAVVDELTTWENQSRWMPLTSVWSADGDRPGGRITSRTGVGPLGFTDAMVMTEWDPPRRCTVNHTGRVVCGEGVFVVEADSPSVSTLVWEEHLDLPMGVLGRIGWVVVGQFARSLS